MLLDDQVAIVTGAGRGIGFGIAETFARENAQVVIADVVEARAQEAAEKIRAGGGQVQALAFDTTKKESCDSLVQRVLAEHSRVDILVNSAGLVIIGPSEEVSETDWRVQIDVMLTGVFLMTQAVARLAMIPQQRGSVVNIASIGGMGGWPLRAAYNAAKAGVIVLTEVLATEWAQHHVRLNCVSPGVTRTEMMQVAIQQGLADESKYANRTPLKRVAEVQEIADAVLFLASERAGYVTGTNLRVDGGWVPWANLNAAGFPEPEASR